MDDESAASGQDWRRHWSQRGQDWRTRPEISVERQQFLASRRAVTPNVAQGEYPFANVKLDRGDVEWLLATLDGGIGPINWSDQSQRQRQGVDLRGADLRGEDLSGLPLARLIGGLPSAEWDESSTQQRDAARLHLDSANLADAHLEGAQLTGTHLQRATLTRAHLDAASLRSAHLERARLRDAWLVGANLERAYLDDATSLERTVLGGRQQQSVCVADARWDRTNLAVMDWSRVRRLGDEQIARQRRTAQGARKDKALRLTEFEKAVRANRQLALALADQGLNETATRFAFRAQILQRSVFRRRKALGNLMFSILLAVLAGYGYRLRRILAAYVFVVVVCAAAYFLLGNAGYGPHLAPHQALLVSVTAIHGRVFADEFRVQTPQAWVTAGEAVAGLVIEGVFIAMLAQRFFGK